MNFRTPLIFVVGLALGMLVRTGAAQEQRLPGMNGINHLAFATPKYDEMMTFYTRTLGFPEAFTNRNAAGEPTLTYLQASRGTFVELMPAGAGRAAGFTHFGLYVDDAKAVVARLRERGVRLLYDAPKRGTSDSRVNFIHPKDAGGVLVELVEPAAAH